jgi:hypothetical protein
MLRWCVVLSALALCFAGGFITVSRDALAAIPAACPQYECKNVYSRWSGNNGSLIVAHKVPNTTNNAVVGNVDIFTTYSDKKKPQNLGGNNVQVLEFPTCNPMCGWDAAGKWQSPQEVTPTGQGQAFNPNLVILDMLCTDNNNQEGPKVNPPTNNNTGSGTHGEKPPGAPDE